MPADFSGSGVPGDLAPRARPRELEALAGHLARRGPQAVAAIPLARRLEVWEQVIEALLEPGSPERSALLPRLLELSLIHI